ncbi:class I SAM-dependent methyltransferase [Legionella gresilensis]|uniref:class I SAM-dependent methyltransferase n=1 Tax=Legionella gresilensis TaxID=91823 RepID=UPI00104186BC|nr:class I SAM-dependent methyltransferase [Legionella gresilensis]
MANSKFWNNNKNKDLFEKLPIAFFEQTSKEIGLYNCCDVKLIDDFIDKANSILDVGTGWGRILDYLIKKRLNKQLYVAERSKQFLAHLKKKFGEQVTFIQGDLRDQNLPFKVDLILWMWAGIAEFNKQEQLQIFSKLASILNKRGHLILETSANAQDAPKKNNLKMVEQGEHHNVIEEKNSKILYYYYMPSAAQLKEYSQIAKFKSMKFIHYKTDTGVERILYIFEK